MTSAGLPQARWNDVLAPYAISSWSRGMTAIATSLLPYLAISVAMYLLLSVSVWLTIALMLPAAAFLVRTFVIFHDCTHGSLLPSRRANMVAGAILGLFVVTPFAAWRHEHAVHHGTAGDLDRRGVGDVETLTVNEYLAKSRGERAMYRAFRNPLVMLGIGPLVAMIIGPRIAVPSMRPRIRNSVLLLDLALLAAIVGLVLAIGPIDLLVLWLPVAMLAGMGGIWLFYVQHQFEDAYWQRNENWNYYDAALKGSTFLQMPRILHFFSANIGYHHLHHLNARIPHYNLPGAHGSDARLEGVPKLTVAQGITCFRYRVFDESTQKMVGFGAVREAERARRAAPVSRADRPAARPAAASPARLAGPDPAGTVQPAQ